MPTSPLSHHQHTGVRIPAAFLTDVLPSISSMEELQVCFALFRLMAEHGGDETPISEDAVFNDRPLVQALRRPGMSSDARDRIAQGLELALGRGTLIRFSATKGAVGGYWYYLNTPVNRQTVSAMERGFLEPPSVVWDRPGTPKITPDPANIFRLYEQNIGPLTPLIADQITQAVADYPLAWIAEAIEEAVTYNRRSWRYIIRILENWQADGRKERPS